MKMIKTDKLVFEYAKRDEEGNIIGKSRAIDEVSLDIEPGQFIAILGHNGSGKSTLAKHMNALLVPSDGTMWVDGMDTKEDEHLWDVRQSAGMVFQNPDNQFVSSVLEEDIAFGLENAQVPEREVTSKVKAALELVGLEGYEKRSPSSLSGGQKQRAALAGVLALNPEILIFDDSFSALDFKTDSKLRKALKEKTKDITTIIVAQRISTILNADQIIVLDEGNMAGIGTHRELMKNCEVYRQIAMSQLSEEELA